MKSKTGIPTPKPLAVQKFKKMLEILDKLRIRNKEINEEFLERLRQQILLFFNISNE